EVLDKLGKLPLPPYITRELKDPERYQTVYSKHLGSSSAPTAGLHFTEMLLHEMEHLGVEIVEVLLHVGLVTFRPVVVEIVEENAKHREILKIYEEDARRHNRDKEKGRRNVDVGTTSVPVLATAALETEDLVPQEA